MSPAGDSFSDQVFVEYLIYSKHYDKPCEFQ